MTIQDLTPPDSPKRNSPIYVSKLANEVQVQTLTGNTRLPYRNDIQNILVTGGAGFIGGWITRHLTVHYPNYNIVCFDKLNCVSSMANVCGLERFPNIRFVRGDVTSRSDVSRVLSDYEIDCVMHFAASSHVQKSFDEASSFMHNNVVGTQVLLDAMRVHGKINRFIHISTDEVYGETNGEFLDETHQMLPTNPYSASKAAAEMYVHAYAKSFNIPTIIVRSNNVYGPCQYPEKIIPRFFSLLSEKKPLTIQGSGLNSRRYLYSGDAAEAFDIILHRGVLGETYNVGSSHEVTNIEIAIRMLRLFGFAPQNDFRDQLRWIEDRPFNDFDYRVDGSKLAALGWRQTTNFETGLKTTVEWYHSNMHVWWPTESDDKVLVDETPFATTINALLVRS